MRLKGEPQPGVDLPVCIDIAHGGALDIRIEPGMIGQGQIAAKAPGQPGIGAVSRMRIILAAVGTRHSNAQIAGKFMEQIQFDVPLAAFCRIVQMIFTAEPEPHAPDEAVVIVLIYPDPVAHGIVSARNMSICQFSLRFEHPAMAEPVFTAILRTEAQRIVVIVAGCASCLITGRELIGQMAVFQHIVTVMALIPFPAGVE